MFYSTNTHEKNTKKLVVKKSIKKLKLSPLRLAIIDLGTNSVRLDIYRLSPKGTSRLYRGKIMIRLGDGVFKTGRLSPKGMARGIRAFARFRTLIREYHVDEVMAIGTSALRSATNTREFLEQVRLKTKISIRVISGSEEGRLIAKGILAHLEAPKGAYAFVDIGGGSTEISVGRGRKIFMGQSFQLGANRLQQMFLKTVPPTHKRGELHPILALRQHVKDALYPLQSLSPRYKVVHMVGSSGTIRTVGRILKKIGRKDKPLFRSDISALISEMQTMTRDRLKRLPGLEPKRVDLILSGAILLEEIMLALNVRTLETTDLALRDGILVEALQRYR
jgi:exopolyphosphatase / guanosine-5'-triphosphate,3'-diphosphate pyrophosphatase